jgi:hypothetical protein
MKRIMQHTISTGLAVTLFLAMGPAALAQSDDNDAGVRPLFATHDMLTVRIEAPLTTLMKQQPDEEYLDGTFAYIDKSGQEVTLDLKLQTRGRFRRKKDTCNFSPIRLNFRKGQVEGTEFSGQDKLKLVTHCQTRKKNFEQLLMREYLAYRIIQTLTHKSFGARLMQITYVNTEKDGDSLVKHGFVIEDEDDLGNRLGLVAYEERGIQAEQLDPPQANLISVYEYLIGNTDFSLILGPADSSCCHNAVLFSNGGAPYTPIPYDFDFSGIVDAPYAAPNPRFKLRSVKDRRYRGRCINNHLLDDTFAYFLEKEGEIRDLVDGLEGMDDRNRKQVHKYMDAFFKDISDPKANATRGWIR